MPDAIVIGTGGVGSAALYHLAKRGMSVLGLDRFPPAHDRGSSHGQTRIIRKSYFEHPAYVELLSSAYDLWDGLCHEAGQSLFERTGLVYFGDSRGPIIEGVRQSSRCHGIPLERLTENEARERFPGYVCPPDATVLFEPDAGFLRVEDCVRAHLKLAQASGAQTRHGETVVSCEMTTGGVVVTTDKQNYRADRLIVTAGCWSSNVLPGLNLPLRIVRKHLHWFAPAGEQYDLRSGCPCFFYEVQGGYFYGFPDIDHAGVKVAEHSGGTSIRDPLTDTREEEEDDTSRIRSFLTDYLPFVSSVRTRHEVCFYTMTPDEHFIVDQHPDFPNVVFAAGLSGHGFKFASALGKVLAELAIDGRSHVDIEFLRRNRQGLIQPDASE